MLYHQRRGQQGRLRPPIRNVDIVVNVKGDPTFCSTNNKVVATHQRSEVAPASNRKSTDGQISHRVGDHTDATVTDFEAVEAN